MSVLNYLMKLPPRPWQVEYVKYLVKAKYMILADDMGLGKTISAIAGTIWTKTRTLIVCPSYLKDNWADEIEAFSNLKYKVCKNKDKLDIDGDYDIIIINYELMKHCQHLFVWAQNVIADEAHYLKSLTSGRSGNFHNFIFDHPPEYLTLMTGTPIKKNVDDLYSLFCLCSYTMEEGINGKNILEEYPTPTDFNDQFLKTITDRNGYEKVVGAKNLKELETFFEGKYLRRTKSELLDLGESLERHILASYKKDKKLLKLWEDFNKGAAKDISAKAESALIKAKFTVKYVKELISNEVTTPIIIFTDHRDSCKFIADELGVKGIDGSVSPEKRQEIKEQFQRGELDYMVATIGSMSTGHTLTAAHHMVFNDLSWVCADNDQARDRINRMGQTEVCIYHYIYGSVADKHIASLIKFKKKIIKELISE